MTASQSTSTRQNSCPATSSNSPLATSDDPDSGIVDRGMVGLIAGTGSISTLVMVGLLVVTLDGAPAVTPYAMTMVFTGFVCLEFEKLYVIRWLRETPTLSNRWLALAVGGSLLAQLAVLYTPLNDYFGTVSLGIADWTLIGAVLLVALPGYLLVALGVRRWRPTTSSESKDDVSLTDSQSSD